MSQSEFWQDSDGEQAWQVLTGHRWLRSTGALNFDLDRKFWQVQSPWNAGSQDEEQTLETGDYGKSFEMRQSCIWHAGAMCAQPKGAKKLKGGSPP